jgi:phosphatidate cytidylyltransferase
VLRARLATAAIAIPLLLLLILRAPAWLFAGFVVSIAAIGVVEYFVMAFPTRAGNRVLGVILGWILAVATASPGSRWPALGVVVAVIGGLTWTLFARADFEQGLADLGLTLIGATYVGVLLPHFVWLRQEPQGPSWVIFLIAVVMAGDSAGYFTGRAFGAHKLMPRVSPGKTVEGGVGILAGSVAGAALAQLVLLPILGARLKDVGWIEVVGVAVAIGVLGQVGDLCESMMKRTFSTKESGWLFPGHGGVLDRIDSLVFPVAVLYYYISVYR